MTDADRSRRRLGGVLAFMGVLHFAVPRPFDRIIPKWVPGRPRVWTYISGLWELTSAALLLSTSPNAQRAGGVAAAATLVAVYPANVQMAVDNKPTSLYGLGLWLRLPMQFPMIAWALRHTRP